MKKFVALLGIMIAPSAFADDGAGVAARMTCADIQTQISELSAVAEPDTDTIDKLTKLKADYRRSCSRSARGRKSSANSRVVVEMVVETEDAGGVEENIDVAENSVEDVAEDMVAVDEIAQAEDVIIPVEEIDEGDLEETEEELTEDELLELELQNLDAGLCADGSQPNKYGCCGDELFKDLGDTVFACCPPDGGDCFPPIKQGE